MTIKDDHEQRIAKLEAKLKTFATKGSLKKAKNNSLLTEAEN